MYYHNQFYAPYVFYISFEKWWNLTLQGNFSSNNLDDILYSSIAIIEHGGDEQTTLDETKFAQQINKVIVGWIKSNA